MTHVDEAAGTPPPAPVPIPTDALAEFSMLHLAVQILCRCAKVAAPEQFRAELHALRLYVSDAPRRGAYTPAQLQAMRGLLETVEAAVTREPVRARPTEGAQ